MTNRKNSLVALKALSSFDRKKSIKSNKSEDSEDDEFDNRDNEGRIRIHSGQEVRLLHLYIHLITMNYLQFVKNTFINIIIIHIYIFILVM